MTTTTKTPTTTKTTTAAPLRVLIADDQHLIRSGLTVLLGAQANLEVVGAACDGEEAVSLAASLRPDVGLFDVRMPRLDGIEATRRLSAQTPPLPVVVITTFDLDDYVHGALKTGARGFLLKDASPEDIAQALHAAVVGDVVVAPRVLWRLLSHFKGRGPPPPSPFEPLSAREEEVLSAVARGWTNQEVADALGISVPTVKTHLASLMGKLDARNRVELVIWAYETGRAPR